MLNIVSLLHSRSFVHFDFLFLRGCYPIFIRSLFVVVVIVDRKLFVIFLKGILVVLSKTLTQREHPGCDSVICILVAVHFFFFDDLKLSVECTGNKRMN